MAIDKGFLPGSLSLMLLKLLDEGDKYGYQMIETLARRSDNTFSLKAGTLYPLMHDLEKRGAVVSYEKNAETGRMRKYYSITQKGKKLLQEKKSDWESFTSIVNAVLEGGQACVTEQ